MISTEQKEKNYNLFLKKLSQVGVNCEKIKEVYGSRILNGTFTNTNENGNAYDGSLLEIILWKLTPYAIKINELLPNEKQVDKSVLIKMCLLHQLAKAVKLIPNDNNWEVEKRGLIYKYDNSLPSIRTGLHSLIMCQECGITFNAEEAEVMTVNDRDLSDDQARWHSSVMATVIRQASELTYLEINNKK